MSYELGSIIYKIDSKGKTRQWSIDVKDNGTSADIITTAGLQDGKLVENRVTVYEGKNIGKANETTYYTQAVAEALATAELKLRGEYRTKLEDVSHQTLRSGIKAPMLAQKYHPEAAQSGSKTLDKMGIRGQRIHVQPKLDGNRCLIEVTPKELAATMYTRKGDVMPVQLDGVLQEAVQGYIRTYGEQDVPVMLDGELFSDEMSFNELNGHLKRKDSQDAEALAKIKYHLYDISLANGYAERYETIKKFAGNHIELIPSFEIEATDENISEKLEEFLAQGHEGLMIRRLDMPYENKRSWQLCKVKLFEDKEFELLDIEEDARGGIVGAFVMALDKPSTDRSGKAVTSFRAGVSGLTQEEGAKMLANKQAYIGRKATVEFFGRSEYFVPRFGKLKAFI